MSFYSDLALLFENYKSFGPGLTGFEQLASINVVVGRNNSGKSALIDLVEFATQPVEIAAGLHHGDSRSRIILSAPVHEPALRAAFPITSSGHPFTSGTYWSAGQNLLGASIKIELLPTNQPRFVELSKNIDHLSNSTLWNLYQHLAAATPNPFHNRAFVRLSADRNIAIEHVTGTIGFDKTGQGFTSAVTQVLNRANLPTALVADDMLEALNEIFFPDASFLSIDIQQHGDNGPWEVFLHEKGKGRISLTNSGSGLKTVLLAIGSFKLLPHFKKGQKLSMIYAFEELENNLHPALQRRLVRYSVREAVATESLLFITTHSNVIIDLFSRDKRAQIIHVMSRDGRSYARRVTTYVDNCGVLDDLDVRASDLLQANGIVWVEGPSDRLYFNRWVEVVSDGEIREGLHYQCVFYGGRLLAHLSAEEPDVSSMGAIEMLRVNRNAICLIDSDRSKEADQVKDTKKRIIQEFHAIDAMVWLTKGREVENYIPLGAIRERFPGAVLPPGQHQRFAEYIEAAEPGGGKSFERNEVSFAETIVPAITKERIDGVLDLRERIVEAVQRIRVWNGM